METDNYFFFINFGEDRSDRNRSLFSINLLVFTPVDRNNTYDFIRLSGTIRLVKERFIM